MNHYHLNLAPTMADIFVLVGAFLFILLSSVLLRYKAQKANRTDASAITIEAFFTLLNLSSFGLLLELQSIVWLPIFLILGDGIAFILIFKIEISHKTVSIFWEYALYLLVFYLVSILLFWPSNRNLIVFMSLVLLTVQALRLFEKTKQGRGNIIQTVQNPAKISHYNPLILFALTLIFILFYFIYLKAMLHFLNYILVIFLLLAAFYLLKSRSRIFILPLFSGLVLYIFFDLSSGQVLQFAEGMGFALVVVLLSYRLRFLSLDGSLMTFILASFIFGLGGWGWAVPILTFFILSSLLSKLGKKQKLRFKNTFEKSGVRDSVQVLANGGIPGILVILNFLFPWDGFYLLYLLSLAVAAADTWSTEIGVLSQFKPILITTLKKVEPGVSGAISIFGTLGGLLGALLVILSGYYFAPLNLEKLIVLLLFSMLGDFFDSLLGATLQAQYRCKICLKYTEKREHCNTPAELIHGYRFMNNDTVNLISNLAALFLFLIILL